MQESATLLEQPLREGREEEEMTITDETTKTPETPADAAPSTIDLTNAPSVPATDAPAPEAPRKRGRPKGSKNKPKPSNATRRRPVTPSKSADEATAASRRGRPKSTIHDGETVQFALVEQTNGNTSFTFVVEGGSQLRVDASYVIDRRN